MRSVCPISHGIPGDSNRWTRKPRPVTLQIGGSKGEEDCGETSGREVPLTDRRPDGLPAKGDGFVNGQPLRSDAYEPEPPIWVPT